MRAKEKLEIIKEVQVELTRMQAKAAKAVEQLKECMDDLSYHNDYAAAKRAGLDLKRVLSKLTKS